MRVDPHLVLAAGCRETLPEPRPGCGDCATGPAPRRVFFGGGGCASPPSSSNDEALTTCTC
eukprot:2185642-Lingulodinium_polyedra.AAC.1